MDGDQGRKLQAEKAQSSGRREAAEMKRRTHVPPRDPCKSFRLPFCTERLVVEFSLVTQGHAFAVSVDDGNFSP